MNKISLPRNDLYYIVLHVVGGSFGLDYVVINYKVVSCSKLGKMIT